MSALGHEQTSRHVLVTSVIPLKADIHRRGLHVRLVPSTDIASPHAATRLRQRFLYLASGPPLIHHMWVFKYRGLIRLAPMRTRRSKSPNFGVGRWDVLAMERRLAAISRPM